MFPLKSLPKVLKHGATTDSPASGASTPTCSSPAPDATARRPQESALASIHYNRISASGSNSSVASDNSSAVSAMEEEEKALRERLIVLEEQKFFVSEMIADANRRRRFDEVSSLAMNVEDLSREIDRINGMLNNLDFEGLYTGAAKS